MSIIHQRLPRLIRLDSKIESIVSVVDAEDFEWLIDLAPWFCSKHGYAVRNIKRDGAATQERMHKAIMIKHGFKTTSSTVIDHVNRNKLDNRKSNLRVVTYSQNVINKKNAG